MLNDELKAKIQTAYAPFLENKYAEAAVHGQRVMIAEREPSSLAASSGRRGSPRWRTRRGRLWKPGQAPARL